MSAEMETNQAAAFFDVDGTLFPGPSLEMRLFRLLRRHGRIPLRNYLLWLRGVARLAPRGLQQMAHGNKTYLTGVDPEEEEFLAAWREELRRVTIYQGAIERAAWHAMRGHRLVLITGTLEPIAVYAATLLEGALCKFDCEVEVHVCATRLEIKNGRWTGNIAGEAMFGKAKAQNVRVLAKRWHLDLERCYAYGDSANDRWMLESVGKPRAVNPTRHLRKVAQLYHWPVITWRDESSPMGKNGRNCSSGTLKQETAPRCPDPRGEKCLREVGYEPAQGNSLGADAKSRGGMRRRSGGRLFE